MLSWMEQGKQHNVRVHMMYVRVNGKDAGLLEATNNGLGWTPSEWESWRSKAKKMWNECRRLNSWENWRKLEDHKGSEILPYMTVYMENPSDIVGMIVVAGGGSIRDISAELVISITDIRL